LGWKWVGLKPLVAAQRAWTRINAQVSAFETELPLEPWDLTLRVVVYRKQVAHQTRKNFQLDLFSPDDGHFEYSAVTTNKALAPAALWAFIAGRGAQEETYGELKGEFAFDVVPTHHYGANSAWLSCAASSSRPWRLPSRAPGSAPTPSPSGACARCAFC